MYILKVNKIIKVVNNCTTFLTVLHEEYTMTGLRPYCFVRPELQLDATSCTEMTYFTVTLIAIELIKK